MKVSYKNIYIRNNRWEILVTEIDLENIPSKTIFVQIYRLCPVLFIKCSQPIINTSIFHSVCFIHECFFQHCFGNEEVSLFLA